MEQFWKSEGRNRGRGAQLHQLKQLCTHKCEYRESFYSTYIHYARFVARKFALDF